MTFWVFFVHFLAQNFQKLSFDRAKKSTFRMSVLTLCKTDFPGGRGGHWIGQGLNDIKQSDQHNSNITTVNRLNRSGVARSVVQTAL